MEGNDIIGKEIEGYKILKYLGQGKFSVVYKAERLKDQKQVAMKIVKIFDMMDNKQREKCLQEVNLLKSLDHPGIVKYLDSFLLNNELYIAIEWANKGDLKGYIRSCAMQSEKIECEKIVDYVKQLAEALHHMHEKRIIHRDLKPANILIFGEGTLKLSDLGLGRYMSNETIKAFSRVGTPLYMSPEIIRDAGYDFKCDIWSIGCVIYELMTFKSPFRMDEKFTLIDLFNKINNGQYQKITDDFYPLELRTLVDKMLRVNPEERISVEEVLKICNQLLVAIEEARPKFDPILIMEDILEQLNLINYDVHFCKRFKRPKINRTYFAIPMVGNIYTTNNPNFENFSQFTAFLEISQWLIHLIKEKIKYTDLQNPDFVFNFKLKEIDKKRKPELYVKEIYDIVKAYNFNDKNLNAQVLRVNISSVACGWGESICLLLRLLLNMYLLNEQFCFLNPKFEDLSRLDSADNFQEIELVEENIKSDQLLDKKSKQSNFNLIPNGEINEDDYIIKNNKKLVKEGKNSAFSHKSDANSALSTQTDHFKFDPNHCIIEPSVDPSEWRKECDKVCNLLVISENVEFMYNSQSEENLKSYINFDELPTDYFNRGKSFSVLSQYFSKVSTSQELNNILNFANFMDNQVGIIDLFENKLTKTLEKKIGGINQNTSSKFQIEKKLDDTVNNIESLKNKIQIMEEVLENKTREYEVLKNKNYKTELINIRRVIDDMKKEIKNLDLKNGIIDNTLLHKYKLEHRKNDKKNPFGFEDLIDEYL